MDDLWLWVQIAGGLLGVFAFSFGLIYVSLGRFAKETLADV